MNTAMTDMDRTRTALAAGVVAESTSARGSVFLAFGSELPKLTH